MEDRVMSKIEKYIEKNNLDGKKIADVLRDYKQGQKPLGEICQFHGYSLDKAVGHLHAAGLV
jgi:hypothetical protein